MGEKGEVVGTGRVFWDKQSSMKISIRKPVSDFLDFQDNQDVKVVAVSKKKVVIEVL